MIESVAQDVRYAARSLVKARGFASVVVVTLALGIGANTAVFSVLNAVVLKPLPYADPHELVRVYMTYGGEDGYLPGPAIVDLRERSRTLDIAALYTYRADGVDITDHPEPERVGRLQVSADYFRVMQVSLVLGRPFGTGDERPEAKLAVVSLRIWQDYLGRTPGAIGRTLTLNAVPYRVVGVMPAGYDDPLQPGIDVWTPLDMEGARGDSWDNNYLSAVARLRPGASRAQAQAELAAISASQQEHFNSRDARQARMVPLQADVVGGASRLLLVLQGTVVMLLLIACVNVASLFLSRSSAREPELAVRVALGCSRAGLIRQVLVETVVLSLAGGLVGLCGGLALERALVGIAPFTFPGSAGLDPTVFAFSFAVALAAGLLFGVAPALHVTRPDIEQILREGGRGGGSSRRHTRTRSVFVVCQVALALMLLVGAGLLLRTFEHLIKANLGITPGGVLSFEVHLPVGRYADAERRARFHVDLEQRLSSLAGVRAAGAVSRLPLTGPYHMWGTRRPDRAPDQQRRLQPQQRVIEGDYFRALGIALLEGRRFDARDVPSAPHRVIVSRSVAAALFPGESAIGRPLNVAGTISEVIGVVGDVPVAFRGTPPPAVYHSHTQFASNRNWALTQVVALDRASPALLDDVRRELAAIDPGLVLYRPRMLTDIVGEAMAQERFALFLVGAFALLAAVLAAIGIYGVLSYAVSRRTREIGIRLALGAQRANVRRLIIGQGGRLAVAGVAIGLGGAFWLTRWLESLLFQVSATDPWVFATATLVLAAVAIAAAAIPAAMAAKVNPLDAFRS
jgi:predicted permease